MENVFNMGQTSEDQEKSKKLMEAFSVLDGIKVDVDTAEVLTKIQEAYKDK